MKRIAAAAALAIAVGLIGCREANRLDAEVTADVRRELTKAGVPGTIEIVTRVGVVELTGAVPNQDVRERAEDIAEDIRGVDHVTNNLRTMAGDAPIEAMPERPYVAPDAPVAARLPDVPIDPHGPADAAPGGPDRY